jgi:hypothetical protein
MKGEKNDADRSSQLNYDLKRPICERRKGDKPCFYDFILFNKLVFLFGFSFNSLHFV